MIDEISKLLVEQGLIDTFLSNTTESRSTLKSLKSIISEVGYQEVIASIMAKTDQTSLNPLVEMKLHFEMKNYALLVKDLIQYEARKIIELVSKQGGQNKMLQESDIGLFVKEIWKDKEVQEALAQTCGSEMRTACMLRNIKEIINGFNPKRNASESCQLMAQTRYHQFFRPEFFDESLSSELFYAIMWHHLIMIREFLQSPGGFRGHTASIIRKTLGEEFYRLRDFYFSVNSQGGIQGTNVRSSQVRDEIGLMIETIKSLL